jgi:hypothetical protein
MQFSATRKLGQQPARTDIATPDRQRLSSRLFTIGHSNHAIDRYLALLRQVQVTAIADVRSSPFSQRHLVLPKPRGKKTATRAAAKVEGQA